MQVYQKVRMYIEDNGLKQTVISKKAKFSTSTFNAMMNGRRRIYADDLRNICFALGVSPETFIDVSNLSTKADGINSEGVPTNPA